MTNKYSLIILSVLIIFNNIFGENNKIVKVPSIIGSAEILDIDLIEKTSKKSFSELIQERSKIETFFILARVVSKNGDKYKIDYYDAYGLNKSLFGEYPILNKTMSFVFYNDNTKDLYTDFNNNKIYTIQYFSIGSIKDAEFSYLCNHKNLLIVDRETGNEKLLEKFYESSADFKAYLRLASSILTSENVNFPKIEKYYELATKVYSKEFSEEDIDAKSSIEVYLGKFYFDTESEKAEKYFKRGMSQEVNKWAKTESQERLGELYFKVRNYIQAKKYYEDASNQDENKWAKAKAEVRLGEIYFSGLGVLKHYGKAKKYYESASNQDEDKWAKAEAQAKLGYMNFGGLGTPIDYGKAKEYYENASNQEENKWARAEAQTSLGEMHFHGNGTPVDYIKAKKYYENAINQDDNKCAKALAYALFGDMNLYGNGTPVNYGKAKEYYENAINQNDHKWAKALGQMRLGGMHFHGNDVLVDYVKAKEYYERFAIDFDIGLSCLAIQYVFHVYCNLLEICYHGLDGNINYNKAHEYCNYMLSNFKEYLIPNLFSELYLGKMKYLGQGCPVNYEEARLLLEKVMNYDYCKMPDYCNYYNCIAYKREAQAYLTQYYLMNFSNKENQNKILEILKDQSLGTTESIKEGNHSQDLMLFNKAHMYAFGQILDKDSLKSMTLYKQLCQSKTFDVCVNAKLCLAQLYLDADDIDIINIKEAKNLLEDILRYEKISIFTKLQAQVLLADILCSEKEYLNAFNLFTEASKQDINIWAQGYANLKMGKLLQEGKGVNCDMDEARRFLNLAISNPALADSMKSMAQDMLNDEVLKAVQGIPRAITTGAATVKKLKRKRNDEKDDVSKDQDDQDDINPSKKIKPNNNTDSNT